MRVSNRPRVVLFKRQKRVSQVGILYLSDKSVRIRASRVRSRMLALPVWGNSVLGIADEGTDLAPILRAWCGFHATTHIHGIGTDNTDGLANILWRQPAGEHDPAISVQRGDALPIGLYAATAVHVRMKTLNQQGLDAVLLHDLWLHLRREAKGFNDRPG